MLQIYITTSTYNIFHIKKKHFLNVIIKIDKKKKSKEELWFKSNISTLEIGKMPFIDKKD
jgi:hypothetical protein